MIEFSDDVRTLMISDKNDERSATQQAHDSSNVDGFIKQNLFNIIFTRTIKN